MHIRRLWDRVILFTVAFAGGAVLWMSTAPAPDRVAALATQGQNVAGTVKSVDCNGNGSDDRTDLAAGTSLDCNGNGVPDECEADVPPPLASSVIATGLGFVTAIEPAPGHAGLLLVASKQGRVRLVDAVSGEVRTDPVLNITVAPGAERGLLGLALDDRDEPGADHLYVSHNDPKTGVLHVSRYTLTAELIADPASRVIIKSIESPTSSHNGGQIRLGPDGMLYVSTGDGTTFADSDPTNAAQRLDSLRGKLLRLDPASPPTYVPADNPYVDDPEACDEIWARGLRNPWRFSFDRLTGDLYLTDVGLDAREEIDVEPAGGSGGRNYGWRCLEGRRCTGLDSCACSDPALTAPAFEIDREGGCWALIGGHLYRGCAIPQLHGRYLFANYCDGTVYSVASSRDGEGRIVLDDLRDHTEEVNPAGVGLVSTFGEGRDGELYFASLFGTLWRIDAGNDCNGNGVSDHVDIDAGTSADADGDGVPDECAVTGDVDQDGDVDVDDLLAVLIAWGVCPVAPAACPADVNRDGHVDVDDLLLVLLSWS